MKKLLLILCIIFFPIMVHGEITETRWIDWDYFPTNAENEIPKNSNQNSPVDWQYSSYDHNTGRDFFGSEGWFNTDPNQTTVDEEAWYTIAPGGYNNPHMGYGNFGYVDIVDHPCMSGNCVRYTLTGGFSKSVDGQDHCGSYGDGASCQQYGEIYSSKTAFLNFASDPTYDGSLGDYQIGRFKWYLGNGDMSYHTPLPITTSAHNRMSYYQYLTSDVTIDQLVIDGVAAEFLSYAAPFNNTGGHWYHYGLGSVPNGWTHYYIDEHPSYNNSWGSMVNSPLSYGAQRTYRVQYPNAGGYWESMYHFYSSSGKVNNPIETNGLAKPETLPAAQYMDELMFVVDPEPQNEETINGMALTYIYDDQYFWLGFVEKYMHACNVNYGSYEIRYRIGDEITNSNFLNSKLVDIHNPQIFTGYTTPAPGVIVDNTSCRSGILVRFKVQPEDQHLLVEGANLWIAVKDVSQDSNNDHIPNPTAGYKGRNYNTYSDLDYDYDHNAMKYIKRIPYILGPDIQNGSIGNNIRTDVDNNSQINTTDAMLTLRNSVNLDMSGTDWQASATTGDADCDGDTDSTDAMLILRYSLGLDMSGTGWCGN